MKLFQTLKATSVFALFILSTHSFGTDDFRIKKPMMWEIQKHGRSSFILGSFHMGPGLGHLPLKTYYRLHMGKRFTFEIEDVVNPLHGLLLAGRLVANKLVSKPLPEVLSPQAWQKFKTLMLPGAIDSFYPEKIKQEGWMPEPTLAESITSSILETWNEQKNLSVVARMADGMNFEDAITEEYLANIPAAFAHAQVEVKNVVEYSKKRFGSLNNLDSEIEEFASYRKEKFGTKIYALDGVNMQIGLLLNWGTPEKLEKELMKSEEERTASYDEFFDAYMEGDLPKIKKVIAASLKTWNKEELDEKLYKRNKNWISKIAHQHRYSGPTKGSDPDDYKDKNGNISPHDLPKKYSIITVGIAHLFEKDGVLDLLQRAGYTVKRVND